jgi:hypothetical protein
VPEGVWAANLLGLSTQVPAKITYLTDGPNSKVLVGRRTIHFKHARPSSIAGHEGKLALVIQALRHLGKKGIGSREIETLRAAPSSAEKRKPSLSHSRLRGFCLFGTFSPSRRQMRSTRSLPTCQPARLSSAVIRRKPKRPYWLASTTMA